MEPNIAERILTKDLQNIVKKVADGKPLTAAERARVESESASARQGGQAYAKTVVELAEFLQINRKTIERWRKLPDAPKPLSNGLHPIGEWVSFAKKHGFKAPETPEEEALKLRKLLAEVQQAELKLSVMKRDYISIEEIRETWTRHIGDVRRVLESRLLNELPPLLQSLNAIEIREKLQDVLDEVYRDIQQTVVEMNADFETRDRAKGDLTSGEDSATIEA